MRHNLHLLPSATLRPLLPSPSLSARNALAQNLSEQVPKPSQDQPLRNYNGGTARIAVTYGVKDPTEDDKRMRSKDELGAACEEWQCADET
jgi:hypothetical protein